MSDEVDFEARLTQAMHRVDAPQGFAARVLAASSMDRVAEPAVAKIAGATVIPFRSRVQRYAALGLAAMLALGVFGLEEVHQRHERAVATQQFETATRITDQALAHAREQMAKAGVPLD